MALVVPKIVYASTTLTFTYPPRQVPYKIYSAVRHDNLASSGVRESVLERVDEFLEFEMEYVKIGTDVSAWASFMQYALQGGSFDYYPDSTSGSYTTYLLEDTDWNAAYKQMAVYTFKIRFRKRIAWP
jgi:hypothetical protein